MAPKGEYIVDEPTWGGFHGVYRLQAFQPPTQWIPSGKIGHINLTKPYRPPPELCLVWQGFRDDEEFEL